MKKATSTYEIQNYIRALLSAQQSYILALFNAYRGIGEVEEFFIREIKRDDQYTRALVIVLRDQHPEYLDLFEKMRILA
jgi:hypothetical protein